MRCRAATVYCCVMPSMSLSSAGTSMRKYLACAPRPPMRLRWRSHPLNPAVNCLHSGHWPPTTLSLPFESCQTSSVRETLYWLAYYATMCVDLFAPFLVELYNRSLSTGAVPAASKAAYVMPLLKKADIDLDDVKSYRPISNLSVLSKLLEQFVTRQLLEHLNVARLLLDLQSWYHKMHFSMPNGQIFVYQAMPMPHPYFLMLS